MTDAYASYARAPTQSARRHQAIVPSDATILDPQPTAIYCEETGVVVVEDEQGVSLSYTMTQGQHLPFRGVKVKAATTGTYYGWS